MITFEPVSYEQYKTVVNGLATNNQLQVKINRKLVVEVERLEQCVAKGNERINALEPLQAFNETLVDRCKKFEEEVKQLQRQILRLNHQNGKKSAKKK